MTRIPVSDARQAFDDILGSLSVAKKRSLIAEMNTVSLFLDNAARDEKARRGACHEGVCPHRSEAIVPDTAESAGRKAKHARSVMEQAARILGGKP